MENKHIELLAKATGQSKYYIKNVEPNHMFITKVEALSALQALETALTEKLRAEMDGLLGYATHDEDCDCANEFDSTQDCSCGFSKYKITNQPASGKGGKDE